MERARFITHKGKKILYLDLSNIKPENFREGFEAMEKEKQMIAQQPKNSVLGMTNVKGSSFNTEIVEALKDLAKHDEPYDKKAAVVGVEGIQKVIYYAVMKFSNRKIPVFDTIEEAKDYLVEE